MSVACGNLLKLSNAIVNFDVEDLDEDKVR